MGSPRITVKCAWKHIVWTSNNRLKWNQSISFGDGKCLLTFFSSCIPSKEHTTVTVCYTQTRYFCNVYGQSWPYCEGCGMCVWGGGACFQYMLLYFIASGSFCLNLIAVVIVGFWCYSRVTTEIQSRLWKHVLSNLRAGFLMLGIWLLNVVTNPSTKE